MEKMFIYKQFIQVNVFEYKCVNRKKCTKNNTKVCTLCVHSYREDQGPKQQFRIVNNLIKLVK